MVVVGVLLGIFVGGRAGTYVGTHVFDEETNHSGLWLGVIGAIAGGVVGYRLTK